MLKYITLFFLTAVFLSACKSSDSTADGIIEKPKMIGLLTDVIVIDGSLYRIIQNPDSLYKYGTGKYLAAFKKYGTDSSQFTRSFKYYTGKPVEMQAIFDKVIENLKRQSDSLNKSQFKQKNALPEK